MQIDLPTTLLGWVTLAGVIGVGFSIIYFQWKNQSGELLREQVDDMSKRIDFLEKEIKRLTEENTNLSTDYLDLKFKKNYLKQIVIEALATKKHIDESLLKEITSTVLLKNVK